MLDNVELLGHSTIKFTKDWTIYFDPFNIKDENMMQILFFAHMLIMTIFHQGI